MGCGVCALEVQQELYQLSTTDMAPALVVDAKKA